MVWTSVAINYNNGEKSENHDQLVEWQRERSKLLEKSSLSMSPTSFNEVNKSAGQIYLQSTGLVYPGTSEHDIIVFRGIAGLMGVLSLYQSGKTDTCSLDGAEQPFEDRAAQINEKIGQTIPVIFARASKGGQGKAKMPIFMELADENERRKILLKFFDALVGIHYLLIFKSIDEEYLPPLLEIRKTLESGGSIVTSILADGDFVNNVEKIHQHAVKLGCDDKLLVSLNFYALAFITSELYWHLTRADVRDKPNNVHVVVHRHRTLHITTGQLFVLIKSFSQFVQQASDDTDASA